MARMRAFALFRVAAADVAEFKFRAHDFATDHFAQACDLVRRQFCRAVQECAGLLDHAETAVREFRGHILRSKRLP